MSQAPEIWFYLLERSSIDEALAPLLDKCLQRGWRALVRSPDAGRLDALDVKLWTHRPESWLPHGRDGEHAARQPVLLTTAPANANAAQAVFLLDGADEGDLDGVDRVVTLFDGRDPAALDQARAAWREAKAAGRAPAFWRQSEDGRWERQGS